MGRPCGHTMPQEKIDRILKVMRNDPEITTQALMARFGLSEMPIYALRKLAGIASPGRKHGRRRPQLREELGAKMRDRFPGYRLPSQFHCGTKPPKRRREA
mgnify:FL=1